MDDTAVVKCALLVAMLGACASNDFVFAPIIDLPTNDGASPYPIDSLTVSVAHAGASVPIISTTFPEGSNIELTDVPFADDLVMHMTGRFLNSGVSYGRSCKFSLRADARIPTPHLWLSRTVKFGSMSQQPIPRERGIAITYSDGSGLVLGGHPAGDMGTEGIKQVERFDPSTGTYETLHDIAPRLGAAVALLGDLADTRVVVIGGIDTTTHTPAQFVEVIDAARAVDRQYDMFPDTQMGRTGISATALTDGRVIAIGGRDDSGPPGMQVSNGVLEVSLTGGTPVVRRLRAQLKFKRYLHEVTRLDDQIGSPLLVTGGLDEAGLPIAQAELYKPLAEAFPDNFTPAMVVPRYRHSAVRLPDGSVLIIGGLDASGGAVDELEVFSFDAGFVGKGSLPGNAGLVDFTATTLPDGRVLLTGGRRTSDGAPLADAFIARLDPLNGNVDVVPTDRLAVPRAGHQATLLCDGSVLISGGTDGPAAYERYNPPPEGRE